MANIKDQILLQEAQLNWDDDILSLPKSHSRYFLNVSHQIGRGSQTGAFVNSYGSVRKRIQLPLGDNEVIGMTNDEEGINYYFVYNSNKDHRVFRFNPSTDTVDKILEGSFLNFSKEHRIFNPMEINGYLFWTELLNGPRSTNIDKAYRYTNGLPNGYSSLSASDLVAIYQPPLVPPNVSSSIDTSKVGISFQMKMFIFSYRYIYKDGGVSVWSRFSKIANANNHEFYDAINTTDGFYYIVGMEYGGDEVDRIELAAFDGLDLVWGLVDTIDNIPNGGSFVYDFTVASAIKKLSDSEMFKDADSVPLKAAHQEYLTENRLAYLHTVEGRDPVNISIDAFPRRLSFPSEDSSTVAKLRSFPYYGQVRVGIRYFDQFGRPGPLETNEQLNLRIPSLDPKVYSISSSYRVVIDLEIKHRAPDWAYSYEVLFTKDLTVDWQEYYVINAKHLISNDEIYLKGQSYPFKKGDRVRVIAKRTLTNSNYTLLNTYNNSSFTDPITQDFPSSVLDAEIRSFNTSSGYLRTFDKIFPEDRSSGEIYLLQIYRPSGINSENRFYSAGFSGKILYPGTGNQVHQAISSGDTTQSVTLSSPAKIRIDGYKTAYSKLFNEFFNSFTLSSIYSEEDNPWISLGSSFAPPGYSDKIAILISKNVDITSIINVGGDIRLNNFILKNKSNPSSTVDCSGIYKVLHVTYTFGQSYGTVSSGFGTSTDKWTVVFIDAGGDTGNFSSAQIAGTAIERLDSYEIEVTKTNYIFPIVANEFSQFYPSDFDGLGRSAIFEENPSQKEFKSMIRFGNTYVEQSNERRISVFDPLDYKILTEEYGAIVGARMVGDVLKVIQNRKVSSIYIGRAEIAEAGDGEQLVLSGNVVGTVRPSVDNFGSEHPRSICVMDRFIYFFDKNNNAFVRGAANGNFDVSLYKMKSFFEKVTNYVIDDNFDVVTGVDESSSSVYISFLKDDSVSVNFKGNLVSGYKFQFLNNYGSIEAAEEALRYMLLGEPIKVKYERKIGSRWVVDYVVVRITNISIDEEQIFIETDQHILTSLGETPIDSNPEFDNTSFRNFVIYFRDHRCETLNFLELGKNQWKSFWSFIPDTYTVSNNPMLTTIRGEVYKLFQSSADRGFFNNGNRNMEFDLYSNINRSEIKDYDAIQVHGNKAPSIELIEILPSDVYPNGQKSRLKKSKFVNVEGVYHAPFLKDMLTPGFESESAALLDGRDLKGSVARFRFVYSDSSEVLVKEICVLCTKSYYST